MAEKYFPSKYTGVRYREHASRRNGIRKDRYFMIRYKFDGKTKNEGFGWESQGYTELKAFEAVCAIKQNIKNGTGYKSLKEKYELANQERKQKKQKKLQKKKETSLFLNYGIIFMNRFTYQKRYRKHRLMKNPYTKNIFFQKSAL